MDFSLPRRTKDSSRRSKCSLATRLNAFNMASKMNAFSCADWKLYSHRSSWPPLKMHSSRPMQRRFLATNLYVENSMDVTSSSPSDLRSLSLENGSIALSFRFTECDTWTDWFWTELGLMILKLFYYNQRNLNFCWRKVSMCVVKVGVLVLR